MCSQPRGSVYRCLDEQLLVVLYWIKMWMFGIRIICIRIEIMAFLLTESLLPLTVVPCDCKVTGRVASQPEAHLYTTPAVSATSRNTVMQELLKYFYGTDGRSIMLDITFFVFISAFYLLIYLSSPV